MTAFGGGESLEVDLEWRKTKEGYQSEVLFEKEGINALNVAWKDQAGNEASLPFQRICDQ